MHLMQLINYYYNDLVCVVNVKELFLIGQEIKFKFIIYCSVHNENGLSQE